MGEVFMEKLSKSAKKIKTVFSSITQRSLFHLIRNELIYNFGFENAIKIAEAIATSVVEIFKNYTPDVRKLKPFEVLYPAIDREEKAGYAKKIKDTRQKICILRLYTEEELEELSYGKSLTEILPERIYRIAKEAYEQGCVLIQPDLMILTGASLTSIRKGIKKWEEKNPDKLIPLRGSIHDMGGTITHKKIIINYHLRGYLTSEIAKLTNHRPENVDRYIDDFERVLLCVKDGMEIRRIMFYTGLSEHLIKEYIEIIKEEKVLENQNEKDIINDDTSNS